MAPMTAIVHSVESRPLPPGVQGWLAGAGLTVLRVGDADGVVVVPQAAAERVVELLKQYDDKESKMIPIIRREKSMLKALEIYQRY